MDGRETTLPEDVSSAMKELLADYNLKKDKTPRDIAEFYVKFEQIHLFRDGNGRIGRLIMLKECLKYGIVTFIIEDDIKMFYYRGLKEWHSEEVSLWIHICPHRINSRGIWITSGLCIRSESSLNRRIAAIYPVVYLPCNAPSPPNQKSTHQGAFYLAEKMVLD